MVIFGLRRKLKGKKIPPQKRNALEGHFCKFRLVRETGLEPARVAPLGPKPSVSAIPPLPREANFLTHSLE